LSSSQAAIQWTQAGQTRGAVVTTSRSTSTRRVPKTDARASWPLAPFDNDKVRPNDRFSGRHAVGVGMHAGLLGVEDRKRYDRSFFLPELVITTVRAIVKA
jgi:hypothetical protein